MLQLLLACLKPMCREVDIGKWQLFLIKKDHAGPLVPFEFYHLY